MRYHFRFTLILALLFAATSVAAASVKWNPGHYTMTLSHGKALPSYLTQVYREISEVPALRGAAFRYTWAELEQGRDRYDFSAIAARLAEAKQRNHRVIILLHLKTLYAKDKAVPDYLRTPFYEGGAYELIGEGETIKLWNAPLRKRFSKLMLALGAAFDGHPNLEAIGFTETALGKPTNPPTKEQATEFYRSLRLLNQAAQAAFPTTINFQYLNHPRPELNALVSGTEALGVPDVWLTERSVNVVETQYTAQGIYEYYRQLTNRKPLIAQIENANYANSQHDNKGFKPTAKQLFLYARDNLKANYLLWTRIPDRWDEVLLLLEKEVPPDSGTLNPRCPSNIRPCTY